MAVAGNARFVDAPPVASASATDVAVGDFNADGEEDLAIVDLRGDELAVRVGLAGATFGGAADVSAGTDPQSVAVGDFNSDGDEDLAVANQNGGIVPIRPGAFGAAFATAPDVAAGNTGIVAISDFNGDGDEDLAIIDFAVNKVLIRTGNGTGATFGKGPSIALATTKDEQPTDIAVGDFNHDGDPDLAVAEFGGSVAIFTGTNLANDATFAAQPAVVVGGSPRTIAIGDFNADGDEDLAVGLFGGDVAIRTGGAGATFAAAPDAAPGAGIGTARIAVGDFNSDGDQDLALSGISPGRVAIRTGGADASFKAAPDLAVPAAGRLAIGDFDSDGNQDLAIAGGTIVSIRTGSGPALLAGNLLANGGAEQGVGDSTSFAGPAVPSWTSTGPMTFVRYSTFALFPRQPDAQRWEGGDEFFSGGPSNGLSSATQTATVPVAPASIDAGLSTATLAADLGGYRTRDDRMQVTAEFLAAGGAALGAFTIGPVSAGDRGNLTMLVRRTATRRMPSGTRSIRVTLTATRAGGFGYNFAFADNVKLTVAARDDDADGVDDGADNCPGVANGDQANNDGDAQGDLCDADDDNDGAVDAADNCPALANANQADADSDSRGDACDEDDDNDGALDGVDACRLIAAQAANGCPTIARRVSLSLSKGSRRLGGSLRPAGACAARQKLLLLRVRRGPDTRVGRTTTTSSGRYRFKARAKRGRFYATVTATTISDFGNCTKARSKTIRVR